MSASTVTETGYEIEEHDTGAGRRIRAVDTTAGVGRHRPGICGALEHIDHEGKREWSLLVYGGRDPDLLPLDLIPDGLLLTRSEETARQWVRCIAALYAKAVAA
ncbi:MAG: hypothetical protein PGN30_13055 [Mycolicibacterium neoaurum]|uniref:hypothetical protein n=1 Tax=Mycolicibacterium neoaurum TaxID=1795 RepID=UPI002FFBE88A